MVGVSLGQEPDSPSAPAQEIARLKVQVADQQRQIDEMRVVLSEQTQLLQRLLKSKVEDRRSALAEPIGRPVPIPNAAVTSKLPLQWNLGDAYVTPTGFVDLTFVSRSTNVGSGLSTSFGAIPLSNTVQGKLSESLISAQNSRVGLRLDTLLKAVSVTGYLEADFVGGAPGNLFVSTNSDTLRLRLFWVDIRGKHWEALGGQSWSLLTPNRRGLSPLPKDIFFSQNIDLSYQVGLTWSRDPQFRFVWRPNRHLAWGVSAENPQQYIGGAAGGGLVTLPPALAGKLSDLLNNGTTGTSVPNLHPDFISKIALDATPGGRQAHVELGGVVRSFKVGYLGSDGFQKFTATGGGVELNSNFELFPGVRLIENLYYSNGGGRYLFGQAPDLIINRDGRPSLVRSGSTVDGIEWHARKNLDLYAYYGGMFIGRAVTVIDPVKRVYAGYGFLGSPGDNNRSLQEVTFGFQRTLWNELAHGALALYSQYSYVVRTPWFAAAGAPAHAYSNLVLLNLRYTLPGQPPNLKRQGE